MRKRSNKTIGKICIIFGVIGIPVSLFLISFSVHVRGFNVGLVVFLILLIGSIGSIFEGIYRIKKAEKEELKNNRK
jgi:hypothetical protein